MLRNKLFPLLLGASIISLSSCGDDAPDPISEQDQRMLDEAAEKLDEQMPEARAERIPVGEEE